MRGEFVGCCGGQVGVTSTPKNFEMVIGGLGGMKVGVRCRGGKGFGGEAVHKIGERSLCTINNIMRSLLFQASLPPVYWVEALHTATYLVNRLPTKTLGSLTPCTHLHSTHPS